MRISRSLLAAALGLCIAVPAAAQGVGVLQSAETMDPGVFKLMVAPIMVFGKDGADSEFGLAARAGYGFTDRFDAEAKLGFFENGTYVGADGEYWILKGEEKDAGVDVSLTGGVHWIFGGKGISDVMGFDVAPLLSAHVTTDLELCGALTASFESIKDAPAGTDDTYTTVHLVPGIEYRLSDAADLVGEIGIALNDNSSTYAGIGIAYYLR
jgi:opacity protein-like surface antigen